VNLEDAPTSATGTIGYCAPEQLLGDFRPTTKTDVFSFGVLLYEIISCKRAFPETELFPFLTRLRKQYRPSLPAEFGPLMQRLIPQCWWEHPRGRPSFERIFREFESAGFAILPGADGPQIRDAVRALLAREADPDGTV
jgi:serine/threonine protein kinase